MMPGRRPAVDGRPPAPWESGRLWLALAVVSPLPFLFAPFPMQPDWFGHVGRYHVMNHGAVDPWLPLYYRFEWKLIGNLGLDLPMRLIGPLLGTERAAHLLAATIPPLGVGGIWALARTSGGRPAAGAVAALPLLYAMPFTMGFLNFCLALALALWTAAGWLKLAERPAALRWAYAVPAAAGVWIAHVAGWGILLILVASLELARAGRLTLAGLFAAGWRSLPFALPLVGILLWRTAAADPIQATSWQFGIKLLWLQSLFRGELMPLDLVTSGAVYALALLLVGLLIFRRARAQAGLLVAGLILLLLFALLPQFLFGSYYADLRLLPAALILLLTAIAPRHLRVAGLVALAGLLLFLGQIGATASGWHRRGTAAAADLAVLAQVPQGARIAVMARRSLCIGWTPTGYEHIPSLAIVRRHAFVNTQWNYAGSHLMRPVYNLATGYNAVPSNLITGPYSPCQGRPLQIMLRDLPRHRFDYVWIFELSPPPDADWLVPVAAGPTSRLYRIEAAPGAAKRPEDAGGHG